MALSVSLTKIGNYAYAPGDISWGEAQSISADVDNNGALLQVTFSRPSLQANGRGLKADDVSTLFEQSKSNRLSLLRGRIPTTQVISVSGRTIDGFITRVEPSGQIIIEGNAIVESCRVTWEAVEFE